MQFLLSAPWWMRLRGLCRLPGGRNWNLTTGEWNWSCPSGGGQGCVKKYSLWDSCVLRTTLSSPSADGWGCVPSLLVVWPEASQNCSPPAVEWGQVLVRKWWPPRGLMPRTAATSILVFTVSQYPYLHKRPSNTSK